jgi:hypothetical protein
MGVSLDNVGLVAARIRNPAVPQLGGILMVDFVKKNGRSFY